MTSLLGSSWYGGLTPHLDSPVEQLAEEMALGWQQGRRPLAEELLARRPGLADDSEAVLRLIYEEICLRQEYEPGGSPLDVIRRFPRWQQELQALLECHQLLRSEAGLPLFPALDDTLGDCRLLAELGRGALGRVFLASQPALGDRPVALKMTPCVGQEHLSLARLQHTHIVPLYWAQDFPARNLRVLCMPYLGGATLADLLRTLDVPPARRTGRHLLQALDRYPAQFAVAGGRSSPARALLARCTYPEAVCWIGICLANALHYAHERGLVHLDLKPSNVLLAEDAQPLLLDFHLARAPLPAGAAPTFRFGGTPEYMSPEQAQVFAAHKDGQPIPTAVDRRSDVYSLGLLLQELLAGPGCGPIRDSAELRRINPQVSCGLADILTHCVAKDAASRYPDAAALAADLRLHQNSLPLRGVRNRSLRERWHKWRRRHPEALPRVGLKALGVPALLMALSVGLVHFQNLRRDSLQSLAEGEELLQHRQPAEAERAFERGLRQASTIPGAGELRERLLQARSQAQQQQQAQDLGRLADALRFLWDLDTLSGPSLRELEQQCSRVWAARSLLLAIPDEQVRVDLLDLAVLWADLRLRVASTVDQKAARAGALDTLNQAEELLGPSLVLAQQRGLCGQEPAGEPVAVKPRTAWEYYAVGRALLRSGQPRQAATQLARAVHAQPDGFWPHFYQGVCAHQLGRPRAAAASFTVCIALAPRSAVCYYNRGLARAAAGQTELAVEDYTRSLELDDSLAPAWLNRGVLHLQQKNPASAREDLRQALARRADPVRAHYNLALAALACEDWGVALDHVRTALSLGPHHEGARRLLARLTATP